MNDEWISVVGVDVEAAADDEFNRWYNDQHVPEVLDCPGWLWGARYRSTDGEPKYLAIYGMKDEGAMWTPELQAIKGFGPYWPKVERYWGRTYELIYSEDRREH